MNIIDDFWTCHYCNTSNTGWECTNCGGPAPSVLDAVFKTLDEGGVWTPLSNEDQKET